MARRLEYCNGDLTSIVGAVPDNNRRAVPLRGTSARFADNNIQLEMVLSLLAPGKRFRQL
jgi:hypothetical protein